MANQRRTFRLAEQMREMIAWQLQKAADPRFHMVTITNVVVSPDMRNAKVYWVARGAQNDTSEIDQAFVSAAGLFKRALARELKLRFVPELKFYYDNTFDVSDEVTQLIDKVREEDRFREENSRDNE